jgi:hypothetical protein
MRSLTTSAAPAATGTMIATSASPDLAEPSRHGLWDCVREARLQWLPELGLGFYPVTASPAAAGYFKHYQALADTDIGRRLNAARVAMLRRHWSWDGFGACDIGIGAGTFVEALPLACGFDVAPDGIAWLRQRGRFCDPYAEPIGAACFWDSLEHIHDPAPLLTNVRFLVLASLPIFRDAAHVLGSKHFKRDEHCWYFTGGGLRWFMARLGWRCIEENSDESALGREDIRSYAFRRA